MNIIFWLKKKSNKAKSVVNKCFNYFINQIVLNAKNKEEKK